MTSSETVLPSRGVRISSAAQSAQSSAPSAPSQSRQSLASNISMEAVHSESESLSDSTAVTIQSGANVTIIKTNSEKLSQNLQLSAEGMLNEVPGPLPVTLSSIPEKCIIGSHNSGTKSTVNNSSTTNSRTVNSSTKSTNSRSSSNPININHYNKGGGGNRSSSSRAGYGSGCEKKSKSTKSSNTKDQQSRSSKSTRETRSRSRSSQTRSQPRSEQHPNSNSMRINVIPNQQNRSTGNSSGSKSHRSRKSNRSYRSRKSNRDRDRDTNYKSSSRSRSGGPGSRAGSPLDVVYVINDGTNRSSYRSRSSKTSKASNMNVGTRSSDHHHKKDIQKALRGIRKLERMGARSDRIFWIVFGSTVMIIVLILGVAMLVKMGVCGGGSTDLNPDGTTPWDGSGTDDFLLSDKTIDVFGPLCTPMANGNLSSSNPDCVHCNNGICYDYEVFRPALPDFSMDEPVHANIRESRAKNKAPVTEVLITEEAATVEVPPPEDGPGSENGSNLVTTVAAGVSEIIVPKDVSNSNTATVESESEAGSSAVKSNTIPESDIGKLPKEVTAEAVSAPPNLGFLTFEIKKPKLPLEYDHSIWPKQHPPLPRAQNLVLTPPNMLITINEDSETSLIRGRPLGSEFKAPLDSNEFTMFEPEFTSLFTSTKKNNKGLQEKNAQDAFGPGRFRVKKLHHKTNKVYKLGFGLSNPSYFPKLLPIDLNAPQYRAPAPWKVDYFVPDGDLSGIPPPQLLAAQPPGPDSTSTTSTAAAVTQSAPLTIPDNLVLSHVLKYGVELSEFLSMIETNELYENGFPLPNRKRWEVFDAVETEEKINSGSGGVIKLVKIRKVDILVSKFHNNNPNESDKFVNSEADSGGSSFRLILDYSAYALWRPQMVPSDQNQYHWVLQNLDDQLQDSGLKTRVEWMNRQGILKILGGGGGSGCSNCNNMSTNRIHPSKSSPRRNKDDGILTCSGLNPMWPWGLGPDGNRRTIECGPVSGVLVMNRRDGIRLSPQSVITRKYLPTQWRESEQETAQNRLNLYEKRKNMRFYGPNAADGVANTQYPSQQQQYTSLSLLEKKAKYDADNQLTLGQYHITEEEVIPTTATFHESKGPISPEVFFEALGREKAGYHLRQALMAVIAYGSNGEDVDYSFSDENCPFRKYRRDWYRVGVRRETLFRAILRQMGGSGATYSCWKLDVCVLDKDPEHLSRTEESDDHAAAAEISKDSNLKWGRDYLTFYKTMAVNWFCRNEDGRVFRLDAVEGGESEGLKLLIHDDKTGKQIGSYTTSIDGTDSITEEESENLDALIGYEVFPMPAFPDTDPVTGQPTLIKNESGGEFWLQREKSLPWLGGGSRWRKGSEIEVLRTDLLDSGNDEVTVWKNEEYDLHFSDEVLNSSWSVLEAKLDWANLDMSNDLTRVSPANLVTKKVLSEAITNKLDVYGEPYWGEVELDFSNTRENHQGMVSCFRRIHELERGSRSRQAQELGGKIKILSENRWGENSKHDFSRDIIPCDNTQPNSAVFRLQKLRGN